MKTSFVVHLLSGGLDSVVMLHDLARHDYQVHCLLIDYGQTHVKELQCAKWHCHALGVKWTLLELMKMADLFRRSSLCGGTDGIVVQNRNGMFLNLAACIALNSSSDTVSIACNKDDAELFPDCRDSFLESQLTAWEEAQLDIDLIHPYTSLTKKEIVQRGKNLGVPMKNTWSCYAGKQEPCGECHACKQRDDALV